MNTMKKKPRSFARRLSRRIILVMLVANVFIIGAVLLFVFFGMLKQNGEHFLATMDYTDEKLETMLTAVEVTDESGRTRRGLVAYSLGNFISNQSKHDTDWGILLDFTLKERATGGFDVEDVRVMPTFCWRQPGVIQPLPALKYYDAPPEGMDDGTWQRLRACVDDLREMIGALPMI